MRMLRKAVIILFLVAAAAGLARAADLTKEEQAWLAKASRQETNGWVYLHIEGKPFARGFQHGYLLAKEIAESLRVEKHMTWWDTAKDWSFFVDATLKMFAPKIDPEFREEMEGITAGARKAGAGRELRRRPPAQRVGRDLQLLVPLVREERGDAAEGRRLQLLHRHRKGHGRRAPRPGP